MAWLRFWVRGERQSHDETYFWLDGDPSTPAFQQEAKYQSEVWGDTTATAANCDMWRGGYEQVETLPEEAREEMIREFEYRQKHTEKMLRILRGLE